jgi:biotin transport system permease protein/energy-coupling factor transport system permease protein
MALKSINLSVFRYKNGSSIIYKLPAWIKILSIIPLSIALMNTMWIVIPILIISLSLFAYLCGFTIREQLTDLKPAVYYLVFAYSAQSLSKIYNFSTISFDIVKPEIFLLIFFAKLIVIMQICSLVFRSTSAIQIKEAIDLIEMSIRNIFRKLPMCKNISDKNRFSLLLSLFLNFIPQIPSLWGNLEYAWQSKAGKNSILKFETLFLALLSICFYDASKKAKAIKSRDCSVGFETHPKQCQSPTQKTHTKK